MTLEEFVAEVRERLSADMNAIRNPEGDLHPALFHYFEGERIRRMKLPKDGFADDASKRRMVTSIVMGTRVMRPTFIAFVSPAYKSEIDLRDYTPEELALIERNLRPDRMLPPSEDPNRVEVLQVIAFARDNAVAWLSETTRDGKNPPAFGPWKQEPYGGGAVVEPLQKAMQG